MIAVPLTPRIRFAVIAAASYVRKRGHPSRPRELEQFNCIQLPCLGEMETALSMNTPYICFVSATRAAGGRPLTRCVMAIPSQAQLIFRSRILDGADRRHRERCAIR